METATSIERDLRREWGEESLFHPEAFREAVVSEVRKDGARAIYVRGTMGPQVGDGDYFPIPCCKPWALAPSHVHEPDCRYARVVELVSQHG